MASTSLTRNLRLKLTSDLTADSVYNLQRIDTLAGTIQTATTGDTILRSASSLQLIPNSADIGGSGAGGTVSFGSANQLLDAVNFFTSSLSFAGAALSLLDTAAGGTKSLTLAYKSDLSGPVDTAANRKLSLDLNGADRSLVLGGNLTLVGNLSLTAPITTTWTLPTSTGTSGQVLSTDGTGTLSWISAAASTLSNLSDVQITAPSASDWLRYNGAKWANTKLYYHTTWTPGDGATKTVVHMLGTTYIIVQILDETNSLAIAPMQVIDANTVTLTSSIIPPGTWTVLLLGLV